MRRLACLIPLFLAAPAHAQETPAPVATVTVTQTRDPVDKSYRKMIDGMDRFEHDHALAPQATLRFQLLPRTPGVDMLGITLRVVGDHISIPVPVAPDNTFVLPRNAQALREDAAVIANRKTTSMTWRARINTPGLPPGTRRLGDLRLECRVGMDAGLVSNSSPLFGWLANAITGTERVCNSPEGNYLFFAERPLFSVTLRAGARSEVLPFKMLYAGGEQTRDMLPYCDCQVLVDRTYYVPIWDRGWPDDTLVEFEYMDDPPGARP
ncbi:hypothetical protein NX773_23200 [Massilia solisilvae]|uniref:DUF1571 domain-containing protein n=1 Tax=Massilia solisilvae TaxID=1811225 RepID=A0ABT2BRD3_9BURK|nr:hypothetical protein [Massilia solisilvae]MCS0611072.1 hypothetical protein [Massilia solisilvae]